MPIKWVDNFVLNWIYFKYAVLVEWKHSQINEQDNIEKFKKKALPVRAYDEKFANTKCCHLILRHTLGEILQCTLNKHMFFLSEFIWVQYSTCLTKDWRHALSLSTTKQSSSSFLSSAMQLDSSLTWRVGFCHSLSCKIFVYVSKKPEHEH
jgi:hypothetical protein